MSVRSFATSPAQAEGVAFLARLVRLLDDVDELNRQLERLEAETHELLRREVQDRFEDYR